MKTVTSTHFHIDANKQANWIGKAAQINLGGPESGYSCIGSINDYGDIFLDRMPTSLSVDALVEMANSVKEAING